MKQVPKLTFVGSTGRYRARWYVGVDEYNEYFGSDKEQAEIQYAVWKAEWIQASVANKVRQATNTTGWHAAAGLSPDITDELTLRELGERYLAEMREEHTKNEAKNKRLVVDHVLRHVGDIFWSEFGTAAYKRLQKALIKERRTRNRINKICGEVRAWMKWCHVNELISRKLHHDFLDVGPVKKEKRNKRKSGPPILEAKRKIPVAWDQVTPILPFMSPVIAAMVTVQYWGGMRPSEVCEITLGELDMADDACWFYEPWENKVDRFIDDDDEESEYDLYKALGPQAQDAIRPFVEMCSDPGEHVFRPIYAMEWRANQMEQAGRREDRKRPVYPSELKAREIRKATRHKKWQRTINPYYSLNSYGKAVSYAFQKAEASGEKLKRWSPGQLRHGIATALRAMGRLQDAKALLGHKSITMTTNYAKLTKDELRRVVGSLDELTAA